MGRRREIVPPGPIPGRTPMRVPTKTPMKQYARLAAVNATWYPRKIFSQKPTIISDSESQDSLWELPLQPDGKKKVADDDCGHRQRDGQKPFARVRDFKQKK